MEYKFEEFTQVGRKASHIPMVSITKDGNLNLNKAFMEAYARNLKYAVLFYDKSSRVIGLKLSNEKKPNSYRVRAYREGKLASVTAIAFLKHHGISYGKFPQPFEAVWNDENELVIIDLKNKKGEKEK